MVRCRATEIVQSRNRDAGAFAWSDGRCVWFLFAPGFLDDGVLRDRSRLTTASFLALRVLPPVSGRRSLPREPPWPSLAPGEVTMEDREAIEQYNRAGEATRVRFPAVRWPDLALATENVARLAEGVLSARCDCARLAFGDDFEVEAHEERLSEAWRTDALETRYAPEGVYVRAAFSVRVELAPETDEAETISETLSFTCELCVSFTHRHHIRPFVDFMGGEVRRNGDDVKMHLDPFAHEIAPADALAWGLNGP